MVEDGFGVFRERDDFKTEFDLDDRMPESFPPNDGQVYTVYDAVVQHVYQECFNYREGDVRLTTRLTDDKQVLEVDHCGEHISDIDFLNETLRRISKGEGGELVGGGRFRSSGNNMAARGLREADGILQYENINDGNYRVRCTVTLPL